MEMCIILYIYIYNYNVWHYVCNYNGSDLCTGISNCSSVSGRHLDNYNNIKSWR